MEYVKKFLRKYQIRRCSRMYKFKQIIPVVMIFFIFFIIAYNYSYIKVDKESLILKDGKFVNRFVERRQRVQRKCGQQNFKSLTTNVLQANAKEFIINYEYGLIWCNVFKAASSSWLYNFNLLAGYTAEQLKPGVALLELARKKYPRPTPDELLQALNENLSFIIVRHPFERLVSAYRDKFVIHPESEYFAKIAKSIVAATRLSNLSDSHRTMNFLEELKIDPIYPTFEEFVRYIINEWQSRKKLDEHWVPISTFCTPCNVPFNMIIKFETLHEDQEYLMNITSLNEIIKPMWVNPSDKTRAKDATLFSQLTVHQIYELSNVYREDLELFDYSIDEYIPLAQQN